MELENIILSEVIQTQKDKYVLTYKWLLNIKQRKATNHNPRELDNNEDPKKDIHISNLQKKYKKTRSPE